MKTKIWIIIAVSASFVMGFASAMWYTTNLREQDDNVEIYESNGYELPLGFNLQKGDTFYIVPNSINGVPTGPIEMYIRK